MIFKNMGAGQSFELHLKGQRVCEHAERGFGGEKNLGRDSVDKTLNWASLSRAWVQAPERGCSPQAEFEAGEVDKDLLGIL